MDSLFPLVSIIVPVYNTEKFIGKTIESVLKQTYSRWELLLVDDGSTDNSKNVITNYLNDERIHYYYKTNGGQGSARNLGIKKSEGTFIAFLDADDIWDPKKLEIQLNVIREKKADLVFSKVERIDGEGKYLGQQLGSGSGFLEGFQGIFLLAAGSASIPNLTVIATRDCIVKAGLFREDEYIRNIEDYDLWFRILNSKYKLYGIDKVLGAYRVHQNQSTVSDPGSSIKLIKLLEEMAREQPEYQTYYKYLIINRLNSYYRIHGKSEQAGNTCRKIYNESECIRSSALVYPLLKVTDFSLFARIKKLSLRKFRKYKRFVQSINNIN